MGGKYLDRCRVARPGSLPESPTYYGPQDFYIGAVVDIFRKRFVITDADYYVLKYIEEHEHQFPGPAAASLLCVSSQVEVKSLKVRTFIYNAAYMDTRTVAVYNAKWRTDQH